MAVGHAGDQPATADGDDDRIKVGDLVEDFEAERSWPATTSGSAKDGNRPHPSARQWSSAAAFVSVHFVADELDLRSQAFHLHDLCRRHTFRDEDESGNTGDESGAGDRETMIAAGRGDDAAERVPPAGVPRKPVHGATGP